MEMGLRVVTTGPEVLKMNRYWKITIDQNGFEMTVILYGKESELSGYLATEIGKYRSYIAIEDAEVAARKALGQKVYMI